MSVQFSSVQLRRSVRTLTSTGISSQVSATKRNAALHSARQQNE